MKSNKIAGIGMLTSLAFALLGGFIEATNPAGAETIYTIAGMGIISFGIWGSVKLLNTPQA